MGFFNRKKVVQQPSTSSTKDDLTEWGTSNNINMYNFIQRY